MNCQPGNPIPEATLPPGIALRPAGAEDRTFLLRLYATTRQEELEATGWTPSQKALFVESQFEARHTHYTSHFPAASFDIILHDSAPIGWIAIHRGADEYRLIDLALMPRHRGRRIASALLTSLLDEADRAVRVVRLHALRGGPAWSWYQRHGFLKIGGTGDYDQFERKPLPAARDIASA